MRKLVVFIIALQLFSCGKKEDILLPKSDISIVKNVDDHSPIYLFFRKKANDTLVEVNQQNRIISTNWIFNIDKRLPLRLAIPEIMKLQEKKRNEKMHNNVLAQNYFSYADTVGKNMAFLPFTSVYYKLEKPKNGVVVYFTKNNIILIDNKEIKKNDFESYINDIFSENEIFFCFDKNMTFENYINLKIFVRTIEWKFVSNEEFVY